MVRTPFGEVTAEQWDEHHGAQPPRAVFPRRRPPRRCCARRKGVIVNIADLAAFETWPAYIPHGISKSGVVHLTRSLARVLAPEVRVGGIAPGHGAAAREVEQRGRASDLRATTPLQRTGSPADVTSTVLFILESDYLTGETIIVDGGRHVRA